jgi:hypothetical protein
MTPILLAAFVLAVIVAIGLGGLVCFGFYIGALFLLGAFRAWVATSVDDRPRRK